MKKNKIAEKLNQEYAKELLKLHQRVIAMQQQQDIVTNLHFQYVKAISAPENWK